MNFFDWTPDLDTGIGQVDEQHKILVRCLNELYEANQNKDTAAEGRIIGDLIRYTVEHFTDEEKLMDDAGYPLSRQHKQIHRRFVDKVGEMQAAHSSGEDIGQELLDLLQSWLFTHISHHDRGFIPIVQKYLAQRQKEQDELAAERAVNAAFAQPRRHAHAAFATLADDAPAPDKAAAEEGQGSREDTDLFAKARQSIQNLKIWR